MTGWLCRSLSPNRLILRQALPRALSCICSCHYLAQSEVTSVWHLKMLLWEHIRKMNNVQLFIFLCSSCKNYWCLLASWGRGLTLFLSICSNDVYDFDTGADRDKKESVVNIIGRYLNFYPTCVDIDSLDLSNSNGGCIMLVEKSNSDPNCCLYLSCARLYGDSLGICWSQRHPLPFVNNLCNYLWLCLSGKFSLIAIRSCWSFVAILLCWLRILYMLALILHNSTDHLILL